MARYILEIIYDPDTDNEIEISEEFIKEEPCVFVDDLDLSDYWDQDSLKLIEEMYDVGIT